MRLLSPNVEKRVKNRWAGVKKCSFLKGVDFENVLSKRGYEPPIIPNLRFDADHDTSNFDVYPEDDYPLTKRIGNAYQIGAFDEF